MAPRSIPDARPSCDSASAPSDVDPGLMLVRAIPPNAALLVHRAINDMLARTAPTVR